MTDMRFTMTLAALAVTFAGVAIAQGQRPKTFDVMKPAAQTHFNAALKLAGDDFSAGLYANCDPALPKSLQKKILRPRFRTRPNPQKYSTVSIFSAPRTSISWAVVTPLGYNPDRILCLITRAR